jgi:hypothetical protein
MGRLLGWEGCQRAEEYEGGERLDAEHGHYRNAFSGVFGGAVAGRNRRSSRV